MFEVVIDVRYSSRMLLLLGNGGRERPFLYFARTVQLEGASMLSRGKVRGIVRGRAGECNPAVWNTHWASALSIVACKRLDIRARFIVSQKDDDEGN